MKIRKLLLILIIILSSGLIIEGCLYINLKVSEKYETQIEGFSDFTLEKAQKKKIEIDHHISKTLKESIFIFVLLIFVTIMYSRVKKMKDNSYKR